MKPGVADWALVGKTRVIKIEHRWRVQRILTKTTKACYEVPAEFGLVLEAPQQVNK